MWKNFAIFLKVFSLLLEKFLVAPDPARYHNIKQSTVEVYGINDVEEMIVTDVCSVCPAILAWYPQMILDNFHW